MAPKTKNGRKTRFRLRDEADVQPLIGNTNREDGHAKEQGPHFNLASNDYGALENELVQNVGELGSITIGENGSTSRRRFNSGLNVENMSSVYDQNDVTNEEIDQNGKDEFKDTEKRTRGPTFMKEIWGRPSTLPRIKIQCDSVGRPIINKKSKFTDFLGTVARNGKICPIDVEDWHKMPMDNKKAMLDVVKERYDLPPGTESWTLHSIAKKWRNWKSELKTKYYDPELPLQVLLDRRDKRAFVDQYIRIIAHWNSEKAKERSNKNKVARKFKVMNQTTGRRSFSQVQQKLTKEKGRPPSRVELFHACFTHANGTPSSSIVAEKLAAMKELANQLPEGSDDEVGREDIFAQIIGADRPGRVRMLGDGVSPSDLWGEIPSRSTCNRIVLEQKAMLSKMGEEIKKQGQHIAMLESRISLHQNSNLGSNCDSRQHMSSTSNTVIPVPPHSSLRIGGSVLIKSLFDPTKVVAKGILHSMDPKTVVGRQALGSNWCEIHVQVVLEPEEDLIRPYDLLQKFEDARGGMIAWPCHLVTRNGNSY